MSLVCAISGEVPEVPVISPASGSVFERRLIEKHLQTFDTDPINNEPLTVETLVDVKTPKVVRPRPPNATSIPALIKLFQDEWDAVMLETFKLRQHTESVRQELTHALYQHDAACRVIARLTRERDQAREALASLGAQAAASGPGDAGMDVNDDGSQALPADVVSALKATHAALSSGRAQKKPKPAELATADDIAAMTQTSAEASLHSAGSSGITAMGVHPSNDALVVTGGADKKAVVYNRTAESIVATFEGHSKKITGVLLHPTADVGISCSTDQTVRVWNSTSGQELQGFKPHHKTVSGVSLHPQGDYVLSGSTDCSWGFSNITSGSTLATVADPAVSKGINAVSFHPDGQLFGLATEDGVVRIWDITSQTNVADFAGHTGGVTSIAFSENGFYVATGAKDDTVRLWDLRKLSNPDTLSLGDGAKIKSVAFDSTGGFLAVGGSTVQIYSVRRKKAPTTLIKTFSDHSNVATGVCFGANARTILSAGLDRNLRVYA